VVGLIAISACSDGPTRLLEDGAAAMSSLTTEASVNQEMVDKGITSLGTFLERHTNHVLADSALFMLATLEQVKGDYRASAQNYLRLLREYPESAFKAKSLILAGHLYEGMLDYDRARAAYERLIKDFPEHEFVVGGSARWLLDNMGRNAEDWPIPFDPDSPDTQNTTSQ
jgi:tetratricopeptide (TPR) repeat protein